MTPSQYAGLTGSLAEIRFGLGVIIVMLFLIAVMIFIGSTRK